MAELAQVLPVDHAPVRRFELPDLHKHAGWLVPRLLKTYTHLNERSVLGWLQNILYNNEYHFLYQDHAIGLAQSMSAHTLSGLPVIHERFVWCEDPKNAEQQRQASHFYSEFARWAKMQGANTMIVEENSDVPHEMVRDRLAKRVFERTQKFAKV